MITWVFSVGRFFLSSEVKVLSITHFKWWNILQIFGIITLIKFRSWHTQNCHFFFFGFKWNVLKMWRPIYNQYLSKWFLCNLQSKKLSIAIIFKTKMHHQIHFYRSQFGAKWKLKSHIQEFDSQNLKIEPKMKTLFQLSFVR